MVDRTPRRGPGVPIGAMMVGDIAVGEAIAVVQVANEYSDRQRCSSRLATLRRSDQKAAIIADVAFDGLQAVGAHHRRGISPFIGMMPGDNGQYLTSRCSRDIPADCARNGACRTGSRNRILDRRSWYGDG